MRVLAGHKGADPRPVSSAATRLRAGRTRRGAWEERLAPVRRGCAR